MNANETAKGETVKRKIRWTSVWVLDSDCETTLSGEDEIRALREYRRTGAIVGRFLGRHGVPADLDDPSTWGPAADEIDWTGFPEAEE